MFLLLLLVAFAICDYDACQKYIGGDNTEAVAFNGNCYVLNMKDTFTQYNNLRGKSYYDARDICLGMGGDLVSIHSDEENNVVADLLDIVVAGSNKESFVWLGASWFSATGWTWADGTPWDYSTPIDNVGEVSNPLTVDGNDHLHMWNWASKGFRDSSWNDYPDYWDTAMYKFYAVCKVQPEITVVDCESAFADYAVEEREQWCYVELAQNLLWPEAEAACVALGGHLPSVHSAEENAWLDATFGNIWLGGNEPSEGGGWIWSDETALDYTNWNSGEPNDAQGREDYMELYDGGKWNDIYNDQAEYTICQVKICSNYEGGYQKGVKQCGFDDEQFRSKDQDESITSIDEILEDMETDFENEAAQYEQDLQTSFNNKENSYNAVVAAENEYKNKMAERVAQEGLYNQARVAEEGAHADLVLKIQAYNDAVTAYTNKHADYTEKIDFLNYELFIIQQIRELLGARIGYSPTQVILELTPYDDAYEGWATGYPDISRSTFDHEGQRFGQKRRRRKRAGKRRRRR